jgi:hypothetical protein
VTSIRAVTCPDNDDNFRAVSTLPTIMAGLLSWDENLNWKKRKWKNSKLSADMDGPTIVQCLVDCFGERDPTSAMNELALLLQESELSSFNQLLLFPEVITSFQVDVFWVMHLNDFITFSEYIRQVDELVLVEFIRRNYLAAFEDEESGDVQHCSSVPLSMCADMTLYLFGMSSKNSDNEAAMDGTTEKLIRIMDCLFLPEVSLGPLHPQDVQVFSDLLATIACSIDNDAVYKLQIRQIGRILDYEVEMLGVSASHTARAQGHNSSTLTRNNQQNREHSNPWGTLNPISCLLNLGLPTSLFLRAFDRSLKADTTKSPFDFITNTSSSYFSATKSSPIATPGVSTVMTVLLDSASRIGFTSWKTFLPQSFSLESIAQHADTLELKKLDEYRSNTRKNSNRYYQDFSNDSLGSVSGDSEKSFPLVSILHLATECGRAGITGASHTLWLRSVRLVELIASSMQRTTSTLKDDFEVTVYASWLAFVIGVKATVSNPSSELNDNPSPICEEDYEIEDEYDTGAVMSKNNGKENENFITTIKEFDYLALSLCDSILHQPEKFLIATYDAIRARKGYGTEIVEIYLSAARDQISKMDSSKGAKLKNTMMRTTEPISLDRVSAWGGTLRRTGCLPAAVFLSCKMAGPQGYKGLLNALKMLYTAHPVVRDVCKQIIASMVTSNPPLCPAEDAKEYLEDDLCRPEPEMSSIEVMILSMPFNDRVKSALKAALEVMTQASKTITERNIFNTDTERFMHSKWDAACAVILSEKSYSTESEGGSDNQEVLIISNPRDRGARARCQESDTGKVRGMKQLRASSILCSSFFQTLSTMASALNSADKVSKATHSSSSSSSFSSSSSSSSTSHAPTLPGNDGPVTDNFFKHWCTWIRTAMTSLLVNNKKIITSIISATIAREINSIIESKSVSSEHLNSVIVDVPLLLFSFNSNEDLVTVLHLVMDQLLTHVHDHSSAYIHSQTVNSSMAREHRLHIFCDMMHSNIMLNIIATETESGNDVCHWDPGPSILDLSNPEESTLLSDVMKRFPFLCGLYVWVHVRCVAFDTHTSYVSADPVCAEQQGVLARSILYTSQHAIQVHDVSCNVREGKGNNTHSMHTQVHPLPISTADCIAECAFQVLSEEQLTHFLRWECVRDSGLHLRSVDEHRTFCAIWNILLQARLNSFLQTDSRSRAGRREQIQHSSNSSSSSSINPDQSNSNVVDLADDTVDFTVHTGLPNHPVAVTVHNNPPEGLISYTDMSIISLKNVWSALLCCTSAVVDWYTSHTVISPARNAPAHRGGLNRIDRKYKEIQFDDVLDAGNSKSENQLSIIMKDVISRLVACLHDIRVSSYNTQEKVHGELKLFYSQSGVIVLL